VLLLGAGGAARGVMLPILQHGRPAIVIANRTRATADALVAHFAGRPRIRARCPLAASRTSTAPSTWSINATSASLSAPCRRCLLPLFARARWPGYDVRKTAEPVHGIRRQPWRHTRDGLGMLVEQAAEAFAIWRGVRPQTAPSWNRCVETMMKALKAGMAACRQDCGYKQRHVAVKAAAAG
jgi:shikimate dehydrogenase